MLQIQFFKQRINRTINLYLFKGIVRRNHEAIQPLKYKRQNEGKTSSSP